MIEVLRNIEERRKKEIERIRRLGLEDLLRELIKQIKINNMDPEYWELIPIDVDTPVTLPPGRSMKLIEEYERGKLIAHGAMINNPDARVEIKIDELKFSGTARELYNLGLIGFNPGTFWLSRYDQDNDVYVIWYTPIPPRDYFGVIKITMYNITDSPISFTYSVYRYKLKEG